MPIYIKNNKITDFNTFLCLRNLIEAEGKRLKIDPIFKIDSTYSALYVGQHEFAILRPGECGLELIGSDEATTCNLLIFRHTGNGVVCLGHLDNSNEEKTVLKMFETFKAAASMGPEGRYEMHLVGGFMDDRKYSIYLTFTIIEAALRLEDDIHLMTSCVLNENDVVRNNIHYPVVTGVGVNMVSGVLRRVEFIYKGPDEEVRSACANFSDDLNQIFMDGCIIVGPSYWNANVSYMKKMLSLQDSKLLKKNSTSPEQESQYFLPALKRKLNLFVQHPNSKESIFKDGKARVFKWNSHDKAWLRHFN